MAGSNKRDGKPTAFQVAALKKAGQTLKGIKTYRDAENALRRVKRGEGKPTVAKKPVAKPTITAKPSEKKAAKTISVKGELPKGKAITVNGKKPKSVAGVGVFRVRVDKADVIEALMVGFAKSVLAVLCEK